MKRIFIILMLVLLMSCYTQQTAKSYNDKNSTLLERKTTTSVVPTVFDLEYIKSKTTKLSPFVYVHPEPTAKEKFISKEFIERYLLPKKIDIGYFDYAEFNPKNTFAFKEYKELANYNVFTFTYKNNEGTKILYAATTPKDTLQIISVGVLGFTGDDDSGWIGEKKGKWLTPTVLDAVEVSHYDDDFQPATQNSQIDTLWSVIHIDPKGMLKETRTKEVHYRDGRKINPLQ